MISTAMNGLILGNRLEDWLHAALILVIGWAFGKLVSWSGATVFSRIAARTENKVDDALVVVLRRPLVTLITVVSFVVGYQQLDVPERYDLWMQRIFHLAVALSVTWAVARVVDVLIKTFMYDRSPEGLRTGGGQFIPAISSAVKILIWALGVVAALNNAGYNVSALLAGIGIGGLAMAMAAKDSVANVFGGITVFTDKPFRVGDRVRIDGHDGLVLEVGIRSTRIRTLEGPVVVVPNFKFTESVLENVTLEPSRRVKHDLGLIYETPAADVEKAIDLLNKLVDDHQLVLEQDRLVSFTAFKDFSLNILFIYYIRKDAEIFATQTMIHLDLMRRFAGAGLEFAYPTQVEYSKGTLGEKPEERLA